MWILYSITAAILWGLDYTIAGKLLEKIRFSTLLAIEFFFGFIAMFFLTLISGSLKKDLPAIFSSNQTLVLSIAMILVFNIAHVLIVLSITNKNATLASLIEISYPLFIIIFSWLLFRENNLNSITVIGGLLVFVGVLLIYSSNH